MIKDLSAWHVRYIYLTRGCTWEEARDAYCREMRDLREKERRMKLEQETASIPLEGDSA